MVRGCRSVVVALAVVALAVAALGIGSPARSAVRAPSSSSKYHRPPGVRQAPGGDGTAWLDRDGRLLYADPTPMTSSAEPSDEVDDPTPFPYGQTFSLHSRPFSQHTIFLDFDGGDLSGTAWNLEMGLAPGHYGGYDPWGDGPAFNDFELFDIQQIWQMVAEDYAPFDVDVTTEDPGEAAIDRDGRQDQQYGDWVLFTDDPDARICGLCSGIAYVDAFDGYGTGTAAHRYHQPALVLDTALMTSQDVANAASHEVGHTFGLHHDGTAVDGSECCEYYAGGEYWSPLMGSWYSNGLTTWSDGEYPDANNQEDDLALIADKAPVVADEAGGTPAAAAPGVPATAYLTSASDTDTFRLGRCNGQVTVGAHGEDVPVTNLDLSLELLDSAGEVVATDRPLTHTDAANHLVGLDAGIATSVPAGTYFAWVDGVRDPVLGGDNSDYGSLGTVHLDVSGCDTAHAPDTPSIEELTYDETTRTLTVRWSAATGGPDGYTVALSGSHLRHVSAGEHTVSWTGLAGGTTYLVALTADNAVGASPPVTRSFTTAPTPGLPPPGVGSPGPGQTVPGLPGRVRHLRARLGPHRTLVLKWRPPAHGGPVGHYVVIANRFGSRQSAGRRMVLHPQPGRYWFRVIAVNDAGAGPRSSRLDLRLRQRVT